MTGITSCRAELFQETDADLGEGPSWDTAAGCWTWVDITAGVLHLTETGGEQRAAIGVGEHLGAALPIDGHTWFLAVRGGFAIVDETGAIERFGETESNAALRFNDAKADPRGRAWAGTMAYDHESLRGAGRLFCVEHVGAEPVVVLQDLTLSNGMGWAPDGSTMYLIDSATAIVSAFAFDEELGHLGTGRSLVAFPDRDGMPDGMCVDEDGCLWIAFWGAGCVRRFSPSGALDAIVEVPVAQPTSCCLGGSDGRTLLITTASYALDAPSLARQPLAGSLFVVDVHVPGRAATPVRQASRRPSPVGA